MSCVSGERGQMARFPERWRGARKAKVLALRRGVQEGKEKATRDVLQVASRLGEEM